MVNTVTCFSNSVVCIFSVYHQIKLKGNESNKMSIFESLWTCYYVSYVIAIVSVASATTREVSRAQVNRNFSY